MPRHPARESLTADICHATATSRYRIDIDPGFDDKRRSASGIKGVTGIQSEREAAAGELSPNFWGILQWGEDTSSSGSQKSLDFNCYTSLLGHQIRHQSPCGLSRAIYPNADLACLSLIAPDQHVHAGTYEPQDDTNGGGSCRNRRPSPTEDVHNRDRRKEANKRQQKASISDPWR